MESQVSAYDQLVTDSNATPDATPPAAGGRPHLRIGGVPVSMSASGLIGIGLIAFLWAESFATPQDPGRGWILALIFAVLLYVTILIHELAHAIVARMTGAKVQSIELWVLGGFTRYVPAKDSAWRDGVVSVSGPLATLAVAGVCAVSTRALSTPGEPRSSAVLVIAALGWTNLIMGVYNLLPGLPLDGGGVVRSLVWGVTGSQYRGTVVAAYGGYAVAGLLFASPFLLAAAVGTTPDITGVIFGALIGAFVAQGASAALRSAALHERIPTLHLRTLTRRAIPVDRDLPLAEAIRRMEAAGAGSVVVVDQAYAPVAIAEEAAVSAVPEARRPWVAVSNVSRALDPRAVLSVTLEGEALLEALDAYVAREYLVVDENGLVYGVLARGDVERALGLPAST